MKQFFSFLFGVAVGIWIALDAVWWAIVAPKKLHNPEEGVCIGPLPEEYK